MEGMEAARPAQALGADAFRGLVEEHSRMVFRLAYRMTGNEQDAEDVVQETFLKAHKGLKHFDSRASFSTWVYRIAVNCAIDLIRRRKGASSFARGNEEDPPETDLLPSGSPLPDRVAFAGQIQRSVASAMSRLSPQERTAFVLRHLEGMPIEEIARVLQVRGNAVKQSVFRAVKKLRRELSPLVSQS
jgi:RNA polymerase sigma-70 factor, ECF subfamily